MPHRRAARTPHTLGAIGKPRAGGERDFGGANGLVQDEGRHLLWGRKRAFCGVEAMSRAVDSWSKAELCRRMPLFQLLIMLMCQCNSATGLRFVAFRPILYARITQPRSWHAQAVLSLTPKVQPQKIFLTLRGQQISPTGVLMGLSVFCTAFIVQLPVFIAYLWSQLFDKKKRCRGVDWIIHFWAWASMAICGYCPEVTGLHNLEGLSNALFVPNHTSFLDILTLSGRQTSSILQLLDPCMQYSCRMPYAPQALYQSQ